MAPHCMCPCRDNFLVGPKRLADKYTQLIQQTTACVCSLLVHACASPRAATIQVSTRNNICNEIHKKQQLQCTHNCIACQLSTIVL